MPKKKAKRKGIGKYLRYRSEGRRMKNKISRLVRKFKRYKNPANALNGIIDGNLKQMVKQRLGIK